MSLSALLLGGEPPVKSSKKSKQKEPAVPIDDGLDALFKSSATITSNSTAAAAATALSTAKISKRKRKEAETDADAEVDAAAAASTSSAKKPKKEKKEKSKSSSASEPVAAQPLDGPSTKVKKTKSKKTSALEPPPLPLTGDDEDEGVAPSTSSPSTSSKKKKTSPKPPTEDGSDSDADEGDPSALVHESMSGKTLPTGSRKKYVPEGETPAERDARTIFIGNVPLEAAKSRPMQKQLKRHIMSFVPGARIESMRFRSIAFQKPTAKLPDDDATAKKDGRAHDQARAASWRAANPDRDDAALAQDAKKFLRDEEKKKIAFIKGELHTGAQTANAYIVFAHSRPGAPAPADSDAEAAPAAALDPHEAARMAIRDANGSVFMERTIRVDRAAKPVAAADAAAADEPKRTVFVGNLDFGSQEEDLRAFFEGVVSAERGPPTEADGDEKRAGWVVRVRIVRDKDTQLGKGFAYVQFVDTACVDELVNMEEAKLKFAKRKLRVQRCKTLPGGAKVVTPKPPPRPPAPAPTAPRLKGTKALLSRAMPQPLPKGDPTLGARLASLSKDERKQAKAADADRIARRAAKKKAGMALAKASTSGGDVRARKRPGGTKGVGSARKDTKKKAGGHAPRKGAGK